MGLNLLHGLIFLAAVAPMSMYDLRLMRTFISVNYGLENFADTCCYSIVPGVVLSEECAFLV